jgi:pyruvate formate lyase activating enzyme
MMGLAPVIDRAKCTVCLKCAEVCYAKAMTPVAIPMSAYDVAGTVVRDKSFYGNTGGGLTISGGEVLMHADFAEELIGLCYKEHITSCLDTSGYGPGAALDRLASLPGVTDILYDIKALDDDVHTKYTGVSTTLILENLDMLTKKHGGRVKIHARLPLIKEVNDDFALLARTAKALAAFGVADATLIPYHNLGVGKARNIGETMTSFEPPDDEALRRIKNEFLHNGVACSVLAALES